MSSLALVLLSAFLLIAPRLFMPGRPAGREIRGVLSLLWWINTLYCNGLHRLRLEGFAPLPERGPAILIANHTCGVDHLLLQAGCRRVLGFMIAREFYDYWLFHPFCRLTGCIPVRRDGRDLSATRAALRTLGEGRVVPIFPEGRILPKSGQEIGEGKPGAAFIALQARVPVIPAYIRGTPPTNNIFKSCVTPSEARVIFGEPIDLWREFDPEHLDKESLARATSRLMSAIEVLRARSLVDDGRAPAPDVEPDPDDRRPESRPDVLSGECAAAVAP